MGALEQLAIGGLMQSGVEEWPVSLQVGEAEIGKVFVLQALRFDLAVELGEYVAYWQAQAETVAAQV